MPAQRLTPLAQLAWIRLRRILEPMGLLTGAESEVLELACTHYGYAVEAARLLREEGLTIDSPTGTHKHPASQIFRDHSGAFRAYAVQFGLTPSSRAGLEIPQLPTEPLAELLFKATQPAEDGQQRLARLVGKSAARALASAGLDTLEFALMAVQEGMDLTSIKGVGPATVRKLQRVSADRVATEGG